MDPSQEPRPAKKRKKSKKAASSETAEPSEAGAGRPWKHPQACSLGLHIAVRSWWTNDVNSGALLGTSFVVWSLLAGRVLLGISLT